MISIHSGEDANRPKVPLSLIPHSKWWASGDQESRVCLFRTSAGGMLACTFAEVAGDHNGAEPR